MAALLRAALATALVVFFPTSAGAWEQSFSDQGAGLHWEDTCVPIFLNELGTEAITDGSEAAALSASLEEWNRPQCSGLGFISGGRTNMHWSGYVIGIENGNVVMFWDRNWPYFQRPVAFTSVTYDPRTGLIRDADIEMNSEDFVFTTDPVANPDAVDLQNTITHELGHALGLDHSTNPNATMYGKASPGEVMKRDLGPDDVSGLCQIYPQARPVCGEVQVSPLTSKDPYFPDQPEEGGCSTGSSSPGALVLLLGLLLLGLRRPRPAGLLILGFLALGSAPASAWEYYHPKAHPELDVHWEPDQCTIPFYLDRTSPDSMDQQAFLETAQWAFASWSGVECSDYHLLIEGTVENAEVSGQGTHGRNEIVTVDRNWPFDPTYVMLTLLNYYPDTGVLADVDIAINDHQYDFGLCDGMNPGVIDLRFALLHESGHISGLQHTLDETAVMSTTGEVDCMDARPQELGPDDQDGLCHRYSREVWQCREQPGQDVVEQVDAEVGGDLDQADSDPPGKSPCCGIARPGPGLPLLLMVWLALTLLVRRRVA